MKIKSLAFSLSSFFKSLQRYETIKEGLVQPSEGYIRVGKEWMTVEEYRRRYLCERCENAELENYTNKNLVAAAIPKN